jgi:hypothetical protein
MVAWLWQFFRSWCASLYFHEKIEHQFLDEQQRAEPADSAAIYHQLLAAHYVKRKLVNAPSESNRSGR